MLIFYCIPFGKALETQHPDTLSLAAIHHLPSALKASSGMEGMVVIKVAAEHTDKDMAKSISQ